MPARPHEYKQARSVHSALIRAGKYPKTYFAYVSKEHKERWNRVGNIEKYVERSKAYDGHESAYLARKSMLADIVQYNQSVGPITKGVLASWFNLNREAAEQKFLRMKRFLKKHRIPFTDTCGGSGESSIMLKITLRDVDRYVGGDKNGQDPPQ